jgi:hypothetical protein
MPGCALQLLANSSWQGWVTDADIGDPATTFDAWLAEIATAADEARGGPRRARTRTGGTAAGVGAGDVAAGGGTAARCRGRGPPRPCRVVARCRPGPAGPLVLRSTDAAQALASALARGRTRTACRAHRLDPQQHPQRGGLARAVGAEEAGHLVPSDARAQRVHGQPPSVSLGQPIGAHDGLVRAEHAPAGRVPAGRPRSGSCATPGDVPHRPASPPGPRRRPPQGRLGVEGATRPGRPRPERRAW